MLAELEELTTKVEEKGSEENNIQGGKMERLDSLLRGQGRVEENIKILGKQEIFSKKKTQFVLFQSFNFQFILPAYSRALDLLSLNKFAFFL